MPRAHIEESQLQMAFIPDGGLDAPSEILRIDRHGYRRQTQHRHLLKKPCDWNMVVAGMQSGSCNLDLYFTLVLSGI